MADDIGAVRAADVQQARIRDQIERQLGPQIMGWLRSDDVIEIMLNPDGSLWVERLGKNMEQAGTLAPSSAELMMRTVASYIGVNLSAARPILECELPIDGSRFEGILPPVVSKPTFTIRRKATKIFTLENYVAQGVMSQAQADVLEGAIRSKQNVLVVGGTGSGKTTLTNAILEGISRLDPESRLVIIEDTAELQSAAKNAVQLRTNIDVSMQDALKVTMRLRPDRIVVGEVRGGEALALIKAWNTGHPGGVATVHANDAKGGLTRIEGLVAEARPTPAQQEIAAAINVVVVIGKTAAGRRVLEMRSVQSWNGRDYETTAII